MTQNSLTKNKFKNNIDHSSDKKLLIKQCHCCGYVHECTHEIERCSECQKSFLPLKYFQKIHDHHQNYSDLFSSVDEIEESDLIKGLFVLW